MQGAKRYVDKGSASDILIDRIDGGSTNRPTHAIKQEAVARRVVEKRAKRLQVHHGWSEE